MIDLRYILTTEVSTVAELPSAIPVDPNHSICKRQLIPWYTSGFE